MKNIIQQNWNFCIDKEATNEYYKKNTQSQCDCIYCENYRESVVENIPEELKDFLNKFGIEIDNPEEIICLDTEDGIINYEVFYPIKGRAISDEEKNVKLVECNIRVIPLEQGSNTQMTDPGFYFDILNVRLPEPEKLLKYIETFLKEHKTCALATSANDIVRCTPIEYNYIDGNFYLLSEGGLKFRGLYTNENVSLAIYESYQGFGKLAGMQIMGKAEIIEPFSDEYYKILEYKKIPRTAIEKMPHPMNLIKVTPTEIDFLNSKFKEEGCDSRQHLKINEL